MLRRILPEGAEPLWRDPTGAIVLAEVACTHDWLGEKVSALEEMAQTRIVFISRLGRAMIPATEPWCRRATCCTSSPRKGTCSA